MKLARRGATTLLLLLLATLAPALGAQQAAPQSAYLPLVMVPGGSAPTPPGPTPPGTGSLRVNAPYLGTTNPDERFGELAIFWFGMVNETQNYADVRLGSTESELYVYVAVFDRRLWHDTTPQAADLTAWDALSLSLDQGSGEGLTTSSHRFVAQLSGDGGTQYQAAYTGSGGAWAPATTAFTSRPGWRGDGLNDGNDDRGWAMTFRIPFASLGGRPAEGTSWRVALALHDRDDAAGTAIADQTWPPAARLLAPQSWGTLVFGTPRYTPPATTNAETTLIRQGLNGATVPDAAVGGGSVCGDGLDFWRQWGATSRDAGKGDFNIQNQSDIADWPCFSKYYVTFPLGALPPGRVVISATLLLHQFGNAEPSQAKPSRIQALTVAGDWQEASLSWNSAPLATENIGGGVVPPIASFAGWPGIRRELDVTRGVAAAYAAGEPLRLALYSADSDYHSGKYFVSSDTGDWNAVGRPTLIVTMGTP